jgi:hypothetical protein
VPGHAKSGSQVGHGIGLTYVIFKLVFFLCLFDGEDVLFVKSLNLRTLKQLSIFFSSNNL